MKDIFVFVMNSVLLGIGLAMDAFSVSLVSGLNEPKMRRRRALLIASVFAGFQGLMPMIGWFCVHTIASVFTAFQPWIPWIALGLLLFIGGKMLVESIKPAQEDAESTRLTAGGLFVQGIATSIDALSVGFTIAEYGVIRALCAAAIIAALTLVICLLGILLGKRFGTKLGRKATVFGGLILIGIGIEIFVSGVILK